MSLLTTMAMFCFHGKRPLNASCRKLQEGRVLLSSGLAFELLIGIWLATVKTRRCFIRWAIGHQQLLVICFLQNQMQMQHTGRRGATKGDVYCPYVLCSCRHLVGHYGKRDAGLDRPFCLFQQGSLLLNGVRAVPLCQALVPALRGPQNFVLGAQHPHCGAPIRSPRQHARPCEASNVTSSRKPEVALKVAQDLRHDL